MANVTDLTQTESEPRICDPGGRGVILPADYEHDLPDELRGVMYLAFLLWCFLGVAVVSDLFMGAIERITSKKTRKLNKQTNRWVTVLVWNPTVANLSLMALGSSAPEILLSVIELFGNSFFAGALGPSTIVGSAAFNLLCIIAVCVAAIPDGEIRKIKEMQVYAVTAFFSVFAYLWLLVILLGSSPHVVEIWEGVLTFLFFFVLLVLAYAADRGMLPGTKPVEMGRQQVIGMSKEELAMRRAELQKAHGGKLTEEQLTKMLMVESQQQSYASYRVAATRRMVGGKPVAVEKEKGLLRSMSAAFMNKKKVVPMEEEEEEVVPMPTEKKALVEFKAMKVAVLENAGSIDLWVTRTGALDQIVTVNYVTRDGTAKKESDYDHVEGTLTFQPNEQEQKITVKIIDDVAYEDDEEFYVDLRDPKIMCTNGGKDPAEVELGRTHCMTVVIIDDDLPGMFAFPEDTKTVQEQGQDFKVAFTVLRKAGSTGNISCKYATEDGSAIAGLSYGATEGVLEFENGETKKEIEVQINDRGRYEKSEMFRIILTEPTGGAKMDPETDGGADSCILTVMIDSNQESKHQVDRIMSSLQSNWEKSKVGHANWADQFKNAFYVLGGEDPEEDEDGHVQPPGISDYVLHVLTLPWKLFFALVPPTDYCGGWICFFCSLMMIGLVTALVGDIASLFGCICDLPDGITAITIVALGTSLPDTFASKAAAENDPYADASVGNVTGSNSVNVFLGLGLPWMFGAIYWTVMGKSDEWISRYELDGDIASTWKEGGAFIVKAGDLAFSVGVFTSCALTCILILFIRRKIFGGELGGPTVAKYATSAILVGLWLFYIGMSSWYTLTS